MTPRSSRCAVLLSALSLTIPALVGCGTGLISTPVTAAAITVTGNWQFSSTAPAAAQLPAFSGELSGTSTSFTGILHTNSSSSCVSPKASFAVSGSADANNKLSLTGSNVAGGTLTLSGTLAVDGKSINNTTYTVTGGSCAFAQPASATSQAYANISGHYAGTFVDSDGDPFAVSADLTQSPASNTDGNFTVSGSATFPQNPCFSSTTVPVSNATVTGGSYDVQYSDGIQGDTTVEVAGSFTTDATSLTVHAWNATGPCGNITGSGTLTKQ